MVQFHTLISPFMKLWDGDLGDGVVHMKLLVFFFHNLASHRILKRDSNPFVENENTHKYRPLLSMKTQGKICKSRSKVKAQAHR